MKSIRTALLSLATQAAPYLRAVARPHLEDCLLVSPATPGSLGDEAMLRASVKELRDKGATRIAILCYGPVERWHVEASAARQIFIPRLLDHCGVAARLKFCLLSTRYRTIVFIGADCLDGAYGVKRELDRLKVADHASRCGLKVFISGFSFNRHPAPELIPVIRALPRRIHFRPRDSLSMERFEAATEKPAMLGADIAFLLEPEPGSKHVDSAARWIFAQHDGGRVVVGLNLNQIFLRLVRDGERLIVELIVELLRRDDGLVFVLIPHDRRGEANDEVAHELLFQAIPEHQRDRLLRTRCPASAGEAKALASLVDFVLSQRMHLAIAALGCGVPVMCCEYQDKAEGMLIHFGQGHMVIWPGDFAKLERLADRVLVAIRDRDALRRQIREALPRVLELARNNFRYDPPRFGSELDPPASVAIPKESP